MAAVDPRFQMFVLDLGKDGSRKSQLVAALEPLPLVPRGSAGTTLPKGATTVSFDVPENVVLMMSPHDRVEVQFKLEKTVNYDEPQPTWTLATADDAKEVLLVPNFVAHAFTNIRFRCDSKICKTDGMIAHGLGLYSDFLLSHARKDVKTANFTFTKNDPAGNTFLTKSAWDYQAVLPAGAAAGTAEPKTNAYKTWLTALFGTTPGAFKVNYKPLCWPFYLGEALSQYGQPQHVIPPMPSGRYSLDFELDTPYANCLTVKTGVAPNTKYRLVIEAMKLYLTQARMTALGERAIREKQKTAPLLFPGSTVVQQPIYLQGEQGGSWIFEDVIMPSHVLIQAFDSNVLTTGNEITSTRRTQALSHRIGETIIRFENRDMYISRTNQTDKGEEGKLLRRREFCMYPFFDLPVTPEMWDGEVGADYAHSHLLFTLLSNPLTGEKMQTVGTVTDPPRGKLSIHVKSSDAQGFHPMYVLTMFYRGQGIYLDRPNKTFTSSVIDF